MTLVKVNRAIYGYDGQAIRRHRAGKHQGEQGRFCQEIDAK